MDHLNGQRARQRLRDPFLHSLDRDPIQAVPIGARLVDAFLAGGDLGLEYHARAQGLPPDRRIVPARVEDADRRHAKCSRNVHWPCGQGYDCLTLGDHRHQLPDRYHPHQAPHSNRPLRDSRVSPEPVPLCRATRQYNLEPLSDKSQHEVPEMDRLPEPTGESAGVNHHTKARGPAQEGPRPFLFLSGHHQARWRDLSGGKAQSTEQPQVVGTGEKAQPRARHRAAQGCRHGEREDLIPDAVRPDQQDIHDSLIASSMSMTGISSLIGYISLQARQTSPSPFSFSAMSPLHFGHARIASNSLSIGMLPPHSCLTLSLPSQPRPSRKWPSGTRTG